MTQMRSRGLGRGLSALIPLPSQGESAVPQMVDVDDVRPGAQQVRRHFASEPLRELADSIREHGLLQPILVRRSEGGYELLAGERRWRAARMAGIARIPALVREEDSATDRLLLGLVENLQREDLDPIEEARGIQRLLEEFGLTHEQAAARLGRNRVAVGQSLRLLSGSPPVQSAVSAGAITAGHARALAGLPEAEQERGLRVTLARNLSVRQVERWVRDVRPAKPRRRRSSAEGLDSVAAELRESLGVAVSISGGPLRGQVILRYETPEDLRRIVSRLTG